MARYLFKGSGNPKPLRHKYDGYRSNRIDRVQ
ncbi:type II toxin-antitoxin system RelE/ParE family toxin [Mesohalobacter halotolerans]|nr:type II toxin-antitoxin system YoeB family toxin [Mesohalobacter halotolerans]